VPAIVSSPKYKIKQNIALTDVPSSLSFTLKTPQGDDKESCVKKNTENLLETPPEKKPPKKSRQKKTLIRKSNSKIQLEILTQKSNSKIQLENPTQKSNSKIQLEIPTR